MNTLAVIIAAVVSAILGLLHGQVEYETRRGDPFDYEEREP